MICVVIIFSILVNNNNNNSPAGYKANASRTWSVWCKDFCCLPSVDLDNGGQVAPVVISLAVGYMLIYRVFSEVKLTVFYIASEWHIGLVSIYMVFGLVAKITLWWSEKASKSNGNTA